MAPSQASLEAVKLRFYEEGASVADWARENGFDIHLVYSVLSGRSRASRGESHRIAVALGLKTPKAATLVNSSPTPHPNSATDDERKEAQMIET